ncbi:MAG: dihydroorotase, partial [Pseudonocardiales bacterium]|nr:dihydroorotase [Pseudonocardiales bacterium]
MSVELRVTGGTVLLPGGSVRADLLVDSERIVGLVDSAMAIDDVGTVLDATGKVVLPGMVDVHVHTREPGVTHKEDIITTTQQAA